LSYLSSRFFTEETVLFFFLRGLMNFSVLKAENLAQWSTYFSILTGSGPNFF